MTFRKAQDTSASPGIEIKQPYFGGAPVRPSGYFGIGSGKRIWGYGRTEDGATPTYYKGPFADWFMENNDYEVYRRIEDGATPIYYKDAFADWLMENHGDEIDRIIMETGQEILSESLARI